MEIEQHLPKQEAKDHESSKAVCTNAAEKRSAPDKEGGADELSGVEVLKATTGDERAGQVSEIEDLTPYYEHIVWSSVYKMLRLPRHTKSIPVRGDQDPHEVHTWRLHREQTTKEDGLETRQ